MSMAAELQKFRSFEKASLDLLEQMWIVPSANLSCSNRVLGVVEFWYSQLLARRNSNDGKNTEHESLRINVKLVVTS